MRAGRLRGRVDLQNRAPTTDPEGSPSEGWTTTASRIPAEVLSLSAAEILQAAQAELQVSHVVTMRAHPDVSHNSRLLFDAGDGRGVRLLDVKSINPDLMKRRDVELLCQERQVQ